MGTDPGDPAAVVRSLLRLLERGDKQRGLTNPIPNPSPHAHPNPNPNPNPKPNPNPNPNPNANLTKMPLSGAINSGTRRETPPRGAINSGTRSCVRRS